MSIRKTAANNLSAAFLAGAWSLEALVRRGQEATGTRGRWLRELARRVLAKFSEGPPGLRPERLARFINNDFGFENAYQHCLELKLSPLHRFFLPQPLMAPAPGRAAAWNIHAFTTTIQLAEWLDCSPTQLDWLCGRYRSAENPATGFPRYALEWRRKRSGWRLLEKPMPKLKQVQRRLLHDFLQHLPPHEAVHSYRPGHSVADFVRPHAGKRIVMRLDLCNFFPSIRAARVHALFTMLGYPRPVARTLTGLCTSVPDLDVLYHPAVKDLSADERWQIWQTYCSAHLPQGAPTSPMLSNLCAYRLDLRLAALARKLNADYTRYADDLAFSGGIELERERRRFHVAVCRIVLEEGFAMNTRKTRVMRLGTRQQLAGLVINAHPNIARREYERLKAILHNCVTHGAAAQNRTGKRHFREILIGRVQWVKQIHPEHGRKLQSLLERVDWDR
jgi:hypothetical protein